jgi:hypothetical protein
MYSNQRNAQFYWIIMSQPCMFGAYIKPIFKRYVYKTRQEPTADLYTCLLQMGLM